MSIKLKLLDISICRTPAFSMQDEFKSQWENLKEMIREASPTFYQIIKNLNDEDIENTDAKIKYTVWKYFNRARFRATPYGTFAAFTLLPILTNEASPPILDENPQSHRFISWNEKDTYLNDFPLLLKRSNWFQSNATIYTLGTNHRYVRIKDGIFEIASVAVFPELNKLLKLCRETTSKKAIHKVMKADFNLRDKEIDDLLLQMLTIQLLFTELCPNITGEDYFKKANIKNFKTDNAYIISERKILSGGTDNAKYRNIPELIGFLSKYLPTDIIEALKEFRLAFLKKYEHRLIPLAIAMDLEIGVGYDDLGEQQTDHQLTDLLNISSTEVTKNPHIQYTALHRFLLNKLMKGGVILLDEFEDRQTDTELAIPNTFSVLLHFWHGHPVIQNVGGCTANALLGRFTIASKEVEEFTKGITAIEEKANPDILFFDIAYQAEKDVDNINRRKQLYQYELPILSWSVDGSSIQLDDILVTVRGMDIILWSKKYQKRMVPRVPSAYNHTRSSFAVFRFLCDMQHHQIKSNLNFKLPYFFPGLHFYPRVAFRDVIVSAAMWLVKSDIIMDAKSGKLTNAKIKLADWLAGEGINFRFQAGHGDQMLCFDPSLSADIDAFLLYCRQHPSSELYISEALISEEDGINTNSGKKYVAEILLSYSHKNQIYKPVELKDNEIEHTLNNKHVILPGGEWLYFEIYCHPAKANSLLVNQINALLTGYKNEIRKWFFIRYDDPKPHIRLRIQMRNVEHGYSIINRLQVLLEPYCKIGQILDIQVKTYFRETDRYGAFRIDQIECFFYTDSEYVLKLLTRIKDNTDLYADTLMMVQKLLALVLSDINDQLAFCRNIAKQFGIEMGMGKIDYKRLNKIFSELKVKINLDINFTLYSLPVQLKIAFLSIFNTCNSKQESTKLLADLIHMHINRLFNSHQRVHEAVLYQYLVKVLAARHALLNAPEGC
ncbi:thiopeptide-type bacteriocin biosynthesis protein [Mucilaginibacter gracilis]|uniref:Thiopeptide-type bacteriocin biosynthesis protein n=1 Tax=Mucilaginibacter gracilis TaxID=423350 RepID=A0A495IXE0_9SPHI|nr:lantibiotic dehydratase [Mucilaginibacter gracilis]RKR80549.1 thiopeptide-type bacteriocin biosynthesis protein [Mucilaginibacter gracilis]